MEVGSPEWEKKVSDTKANRDREEIAKLQAAGLLTQWEILQTAEAALEEAKKAVNEQRGRYATQLAEALRVTKGTRVTKISRRGLGAHAREVVKTFEVTKYSAWGATALNLWGRTVREDGSLGATFEIGTQWERVKEGESA